VDSAAGSVTRRLMNLAPRFSGPMVFRSNGSLAPWPGGPLDL